MLDVAIVGAGQGGLGTAFGLLRERISNIQVFDRNHQGLEGPWVTFARMITLRTPKHITGPDYGVASLTPRAWYEAKYGVAAWAGLDKIAPGLAGLSALVPPGHRHSGAKRRRCRRDHAGGCRA